MGWHGPPPLSALNRSRPLITLIFLAWQIHTTDGPALISTLNEKKIFLITPLEPAGLGPLLSEAMGSTLLYPGRKSLFSMTDTSVALVWTVTCHGATLASEKPGGDVFVVGGRLRSAF